MNGRRRIDDELWCLQCLTREEMSRYRMETEAQYGAEEEVHDRLPSEKEHDRSIEDNFDEQIDDFEHRHRLRYAQQWPNAVEQRLSSNVEDLADTRLKEPRFEIGRQVRIQEIITLKSERKNGSFPLRDSILCRFLLVMIDVILLECNRRWNTQGQIRDVAKNPVGHGPMIAERQIVAN